jgi:hypothetical protein
MRRSLRAMHGFPRSVVGSPRTVLVLRRSISCAVLSLGLISPASAEMNVRSSSNEVRILSSTGGVAASYVSFFTQVQKSGKKVVIDGPCLSACTLVLSIVPRDRICVTRRAVLGFHAPTFVDRNGRSSHPREATRAVTAYYPAAVRTWLRQKGGLKRDFIYLQGGELAALYRRC